MRKTRLLPRRRVRPGQTIVIVALSALVLIGLVALAVDGGSALVQRRNMQNASDAAALGASQLMQSNMTTTCSVLGCHPAYLLTNQDVRNRVQELVAANGAQTYTLEYHFNTCSQGGNCYAPPGPGTDPLPAGYPWVDGIRVSAGISSTTTFAQAINIPYIPVQAVSAARLYPTCVPMDLSGAVLPLTRFRPALETELAGTQGVSNDLCHPLKLWDWHPAPGGTDIPSPYFSGGMSFNETPFFPTPRVFTQFDDRAGTAGGLANYHADSGVPPYGSCPVDCADMTGSASAAGDLQDITNWIFWRWGLTPSTGILSSTNGSWPQNTSTWYPANRTNNGGQVAGCCRPRLGDWTDIYPDANLFQNGDDIQDAVADVAHYNPTTTLTGLNWGKGLDVNMYLWGSALSDFTANSGDNNSAQMWLVNAPDPRNDPNCGIDPNPPCAYPPYTGWEDLTIGGSYGGYSVSTAFPSLPPAPQINRVRFTRAVRVRLYENLNSEAGVVSSYCPTLPNMGDAANYNTVWGYVMNVPQPGPADAALCSAPGIWMPGGGVYSRLIDPSAP